MCSEVHDSQMQKEHFNHNFLQLTSDLLNCSPSKMYVCSALFLCHISTFRKSPNIFQCPVSSSEVFVHLTNKVCIVLMQVKNSSQIKPGNQGRCIFLLNILIIMAVQGINQCKANMIYINKMMFWTYELSIWWRQNNLSRAKNCLCETELAGVNLVIHSEMIETYIQSSWVYYNKKQELYKNTHCTILLSFYNSFYFSEIFPH